MLKSAYLLAKMGADTAENERMFAEDLPRRFVKMNWTRGPVPRAAAGRRPAAGGRAPRPPVLLRGPVYPALSRLSCLLLSKIGKVAKFANLWRARSQLYKNEILQENMRLTAFFKLYKICILLHRCNIIFFSKKPVWKIWLSAIFVKILVKFRKYFANLQILPNFKNFSLIIW